jgi:hypothetical protein
MSEEPTDSSEEMSEESKESAEEQKRRIRRKLLKLGTYTSIAMISSFIASKTVLAPVKTTCKPSGGCNPQTGS